MKTIKFLLPFLSASSLLFTAEGSFNREVDQPLLDAIGNFDEAAVVTCLQNGANPNMDINPAIYDVKALDETVLFHAFKWCDTIFQLEFCFGMDNSITVPTEEQAINFESIKKIIKHLLVAGANLAAENSHRYSPLRYAVNASGSQAQWLDIVRLLCEHGANVHEIIERGTLLHSACYYGSPLAAAILIEYGVSVHKGFPPLLREALNGRDAQCFKLFLEHGASLHEGFSDCVTPLHQACRLFPVHQACRLFPVHQACRLFPGEIINYNQKEIVTLLLSIARRTAQQRDRGLQGWLAERVDL